MLARIAVLAVLAASALHAQAAQDVRFDLPALPAFERYTDLLAKPGFLAIALENNGLSPSMSSKLKVSEEGRAAEIRNATVRFTGRKGTVFTYEAGYLLGLGDTKISFPASVDLSGLANGKVEVVLSPPLAGLIPAELTDKIRVKAALVANSQAQRKVLAYLDERSKGDVAQAILLDAYNRSGGPATDLRDVGDAVPLSDQWLLLLTLAIWLIVVPAVLVWQRFRRRKVS